MPQNQWIAFGSAERPRRERTAAREMFDGEIVLEAEH